VVSDVSRLIVMVIGGPFMPGTRDGSNLENAPLSTESPASQATPGGALHAQGTCSDFRRTNAATTDSTGRLTQAKMINKRSAEGTREAYLHNVRPHPHREVGFGISRDLVLQVHLAEGKFLVPRAPGLRFFILTSLLQQRETTHCSIPCGDLRSRFTCQPWHTNMDVQLAYLE